MNEIQYNCNIICTPRKRIIITCFKYTYINSIINILNEIDFYIVTKPKPMLKLYCLKFDETDLYKYAINFIIDNEIGKYSHSDILDDIGYYNIIMHFNIIDNKILLQLL